MQKYKEEVIIRSAMEAIRVDDLEVNVKNLKLKLEEHILYENRDFTAKVLVATHILGKSANTITSNEILKQLPVVKELFPSSGKLIEMYDNILKNYE